MAKILSKTGITTTSTVQAGHVSQSIDAFAGIKAYDISLSGSFHMTGSITGQPGVINNLTASYAMSASVEITKEVSSSFADLAAGLTLTPTISVANIVASGSGGVAIIVSGSIIPEGSGSHNLGSLTNPFKELFITDNSLILVSSSISASIAQQTTASFNATLDSDGVLVLDGAYTGSFEGKFKGVGDLITSLAGVNKLTVTGSNAVSILSGTTTMGGDPSAAQPGEGETTIKGASLAITSTATTITSALNINNAPVTNITASGNISSSFTSTGSFGRTSTLTLDLDSIQGNWTNAGNTVADLGSITTVDINGGTINGITDLAVADGGTGVSTLTDGGVLLGNGTGAITAMAVLTDGQMIVGDGSTDPVAESGATLRTSIGVGTTDSVLFTNISASGDISSSGIVTGLTGSFSHLQSGNISSSGTITANAFIGDITGDLTGQADTVATIAGLAPNTATTQATQAAITTAANLTTVGALNVGSITSGFTSIDVGAGAITTTGTVSAGTVNASGIISASQVFDGTYYQWEVSVLADTDDDTNWQGPPTTGLIGAVNWSKDFGTAYDGVANIVQTRTNINTGWRIPHSANYSASIKSIDVYVGGGTNATIDATDHLSASLWYSTAADVDERLNQSGTTGITQRHGGTAITTQTGQTLVKFNNYLITQSINVDLAPGAMLWPRVKMADGSSQNLLWNIYYIVNYCKKPL